MVSQSNTLVFERQSKEQTPTPSRITYPHDATPTKKKKHITATKEITLLNPQVPSKVEAVAIPKNIDFPTPSTPLR